MNAVVCSLLESLDNRPKGGGLGVKRLKTFNLFFRFSDLNM